MPDNYYSDEPMPDSSPGEESAAPEEKGSGKTYLINSEVCPGMKPGDEMVVKIERVLDGEYEVSYAPEKGEEEEAGGSEPAMMEGGGGSAMAPYMQ